MSFIDTYAPFLKHRVTAAWCGTERACDAIGRLLAARGNKLGYKVLLEQHNPRAGISTAERASSQAR
jgi:hypothetical protein